MHVGLIFFNTIFIHRGIESSIHTKINFSISWMGLCHCLLKTIDFIGGNLFTASQILSMTLSIICMMKCDNFKSCVVVFTFFPPSNYWIIFILQYKPIAFLDFLTGASVDESIFHLFTSHFRGISDTIVTNPLAWKQLSKTQWQVIEGLGVKETCIVGFCHSYHAAVQCLRINFLSILSFFCGGKCRWS